MRLFAATLLVAACLLALPAASATPDAPKCWGSGCDLVNQVCHTLGSPHNCVGVDTPGVITKCNGDVCDSMNYICEHYLHRGTCVLVAAPDANVPTAPLRCVGLPCDVINTVCIRVLHASCVG